MLEILFENVVEITLAMSVIILLLMIFSKVLEQNFSAKWRYRLWILLAVRLLLPINFSLASPPVQLPATRIAGTLTSMAPVRIGSFASSASSSAGGVIDWSGILLIVWLSGTAIFLIWHLLSYSIFIKSIQSSCTVISQPDIIGDYQDLCREMHIRQKIPLLSCTQISSPLVLGFWKQALLLPAASFTPQQLRMILSHELVHVRRRDVLYKTLFLVVRAIHWFNPLVHMLAIQACKDVEVSCDLTVVENHDVGFRKEYSKAILSVIHSGNHSQVIFSTHFGGGKNMLIKRFESLFDMRKKRKGIVPFVLIILVIGIIGLCISCGQTATTETDPKLSGKWVEEISQDIEGLPLDSIEFFTDGTAEIADKYEATYKIVNGKLQCAVEHEIYTGDYKIEGTKLTIYTDDGEFKVYIKQ